MKESESWFIWFLHLIFGVVLGVGLGFACGGMFLRYGLMDLNAIPPWCLGGALMGGGITSLRGNHLWYGNSIWSEEEPILKPASRLCSLGIGAAGIGVLLLNLWFHLRLFSDSQGVPYHPKLGPGVAFSTLFAAAFLWLGIYSLRDGAVPGIKRQTDCTSSLLEYWMCVVYYFFLAGVGLLPLIRYLHG